MDKSKKINLLSYLLIGVLGVAVIGLCFSIFKGTDTNEATTAPPTQSSQSETVNISTTVAVPDTTQAITTDSTAPSATEGTTAPSATQTTAPQGMTVQQVCDAYNSAVNTLKADKAPLTVHKDEKIDMTITEFSLPAPMEQVNSVMRSIVPDTLEDYTFENGIRTDKSKAELNNTIPPFGKNSAVGEANVSVAEITKTAEGQEILIKLIPESSSYDGTATTPTPNMSSILDPLDFATFNMGPIGVQKAEISYPDTILRANIDSSGKLTKLVIELPVVTSCTGGMSVFTADVGLDMKVTTIYEISYN